MLRYESGDGKIREEYGIVKNNLGEDIPLEVRGYYSYYQPSGVRRDVFYEADKDGYREIANQTKDEFDQFIERNLIISLAG